MKNLDISHLLLLGFLYIGVGIYFFLKIKQRLEVETFIKVYPGVKAKINLPPKWILGLRYILYLAVTILLGIAILNPSFSEEAGVDEKSIAGVSYSKFMASLKKLGIEMNRKTLADIAYNDKEVFAAIVEKTKLAA